MNTESKWSKFIKELSNLYFFWFFGAVFFLIFRIVFIAIYHKQIREVAGISDYTKVLFMGFRFDATVVAYFMMIPFLLLLILSAFNQFKLVRILRIIHQYLFVILSTIVCLITLNYFKEYNDQFNNFLFLALYDDQKAVLKTVLEDFHPILNGLFLIGIIIVGIFIFKYFETKEFIFKKLFKIESKFGKIALVFLTLILFVGGVRGSFTEVPAIRKWAGVSSDSFLNKTVLNPFRSFRYALKDFNELNLLNGKNPFCDENQFASFYPQEKVSDIIKKNSQGASIEKPKQIFLVVMESYDSWPLMDKYIPFGFSKNLNALAKKGTHFSHFLPGATSTFDSYGTIVTNVPQCGVNISQLGTINEPFVSSIFAQFKKLGYQTNFFYGGFLSWENIGDFTKYQGVDRIFSGVDAGGQTDSGDWGVEDEKLFDLVLKNTDTTKYSLNVILTSSYHPPYSIDIYKKGFPYKSKADFPKEVQQYYDNGMTMEELGHLWYSDKAIGDFVKLAEQKYNTGLFCFTGDHFGRRFINYKANLYERSSVSFIMYGKNIPKSLNTTPGTHIDIMPTLVEMIAPKGFEYFSFGNSLYSKDKKEAISLNKMVTPNEMYHFPTDAKVEKIDLNTFQETQLEKSDLVEKHNKLMSLAWYYTMKGNKIKKEKTKK
jgi:phosphoglycerol transferase MdoB-like AlkP superfamily enzyme